jgi:predicted RNA-binding protein YlqC (UPF0109 family)
MKQTADRPDDMRELVNQIARALVDIPEAVIVEAVERDESTVIGKQGRTARSVRTILGAVSMKHHHRYTLDILEEDHQGASRSEE